MWPVPSTHPAAVLAITGFAFSERLGLAYVQEPVNGHAAPNCPTHR